MGVGSFILHFGWVGVRAQFVVVVFSNLSLIQFFRLFLFLLIFLQDFLSSVQWRSFSLLSRCLQQRWGEKPKHRDVDLKTRPRHLEKATKCLAFFEIQIDLMFFFSQMKIENFFHLQFSGTMCKHSWLGFPCNVHVQDSEWLQLEKWEFISFLTNSNMCSGTLQLWRDTFNPIAPLRN